MRAVASASARSSRVLRLIFWPSDSKRRFYRVESFFNLARDDSPEWHEWPSDLTTRAAPRAPCAGTLCSRPYPPHTASVGPFHSFGRTPFSRWSQAARPSACSTRKARTSHTPGRAMIGHALPAAKKERLHGLPGARGYVVCAAWLLPSVAATGCAGSDTPPLACVVCSRTARRIMRRAITATSSPSACAMRSKAALSP